MFAKLKGLMTFSRPCAAWLRLTFCPLLLGLSPTAVFAQTEILNYHVEWRLIQAGAARVTINKTPTNVTGKLELTSIGLVSRLFKVNDIYDVNWRPDLCAQSSHLNAEEGSRRRETNILFNGPNGKTQYTEKDLVKNTVAQNAVAVPSCVEDVLGALQKIRAMKLTLGTSTQIPITDGKKFVEVRVDVQEKEDVKTATATHKTIRLEAFLFNGVLYERTARCLIWVTDDEKRTPVMIQIRMRFHIGTVTLMLDK